MVGGGGVLRLLAVLGGVFTGCRDAAPEGEAAVGVAKDDFCSSGGGVGAGVGEGLEEDVGDGGGGALNGRASDVLEEVYGSRLVVGAHVLV
eukprot:CAMPEP_0178694084 /NCGR_PEP_ID=MMETSP0699-20121125/8056_1 /TAXON_ID=265572 /ORGANISM="Extubocellulus spinifer, Strain CCMP396" /LENGTH=90 /DNA_ID=CAMNT_0020339537 /DNA_START=249 /DNA_END=521 /DNA_ORIENTATION=+